MQEVLERTNGAVRIWPATLYGSLKRLIADGLIEESDERPVAELDDARRGYYRLTRLGRNRARTGMRAAAGDGPDDAKEAPAGGLRDEPPGEPLPGPLSTPGERISARVSRVVWRRSRPAGRNAAPEAWRRYGFAGLVRLLADIALRLPPSISPRSGRTWSMLCECFQGAGVCLGGGAVARRRIGMCCALFSECRAIVGPAPGLRDPARSRPSFGPGFLSVFRALPGCPRDGGGGGRCPGTVPFAVAFNGDKSARAERVLRHLVSPGYFTTLGVAPALGRVFRSGNGEAGHGSGYGGERPLLAHPPWRGPAAVGRTLRLNGSLATIVGIGPEGLSGYLAAESGGPVCARDVCSALAPELGGDALHRRPARSFASCSGWQRRDAARGGGRSRCR